MIDDTFQALYNVPEGGSTAYFLPPALRLQPCQKNERIDPPMKNSPGNSNFRTKLWKDKTGCLIMTLLLAFSLLAVMMFLSGCEALLEEFFENEEEEQEMIILAVYEIRDDFIYLHDCPDVNGAYIYWQEDRGKHEALWEMVHALYPPDMLELLAYLEIVTDGMDDTMGAIEGVDDAEEDIYTLSLDIIDLYGNHSELVMQILVETLLHELGHLITLNESQVDPVEYENSNPRTFYTDYGDCREDSYLNLFFQRFWVDLYDQWSKAAEIEDDMRREKALEHFYLKHEDEFVSDYAATHPDEDIAETMMMFFLVNRPPGRDIAEQKILFLYEFPELVEMREEIRAVLRDYDYPL